jgi:murein L,D-transpeptidase YafK
MKRFFPTRAGLILFACLLANGCGRPAPLAAAPEAPRTDLLNYHRSLSDLAGPGGVDRKQVSLRIEKTQFRLTVYVAGKPLKAYPIVLGRNPTDDKLREGDGCTPEGRFRIKAMYPHRAWSKFLWLDYPTADSWRKFNTAKRQGLIPKRAAIGGEIGIHGVPDRNDRLIDTRTNWTLGCISLKTADIEELYGVVRRGTVVEIAH